MTDIGPLQVRRDTRENLRDISPAEGEVLLSIDEANEGQLHVGTLGGGPTGGVRIGLRARDKMTLKGAPGVAREVDQTSHIMACNTGWQAGPSGWFIPSRVAGEMKHWPIIQGKLPARSISNGGWIDFHMDGWYRRPPMTGIGTQDAIFARLMVGTTYIGPDSFGAPGSEIGWGWPGQGDGLAVWDQKGAVLQTTTGGPDNYDIITPAPDNSPEFPDGTVETHLQGANGNDCNIYFDFNLRMRCISPQGTPIEHYERSDDAVLYKWKLTGEFEVYAGQYNNLRKESHSSNQTYDPDTATGFERHVKLIRDFLTLPDPGRTNVFRLEIGSPRSNSTTAFTPNDEITVHSASMIAHGITRGRQIYRNDIGDPMYGPA